MVSHSFKGISLGLVVRMIKSDVLHLFISVYSLSGLMRMQELIKAPSKNSMKVRIRQLPTESSDARPLLKEIKKEQEFNVIFDCTYQIASELLKQVKILY